MRYGAQEGVAYSLSRYTDLVATKWDWFREQIRQGSFEGFRTDELMPDRWSLNPEHVESLVFWTKDPRNIVCSQKLLEPYIRSNAIKVHMTLTGWEEVEKGAPTLSRGLDLMKDVVGALRPYDVYWRFSPIPLLPKVQIVERYKRIANMAGSLGLPNVMVSFLQDNGKIPETRTDQEKLDILSELGNASNLKVVLCRDDDLLRRCNVEKTSKLQEGICWGTDWIWEIGRGGKSPPKERCGCHVMVDPFTMNEVCAISCGYCYSANPEGKRVNTTKGPSGPRGSSVRHLPLLKDVVST